MGTGIYFPLLAIPFSLIIIFLYFIKGHINNRETWIFGTLIISNFLGLIIEMLCTYASAIYSTNRLLSNIIYKLYLLYLILWISTFAYYVFSISRSEIEIKKKRIPLFIAYYIIIILVLCLLPITAVISEDFNIRYTTGMGVTFTYIISGGAIMSMIIILFTNIKKIKNKKYIPVFFFLVFGGLVSVIQFLYPQILLMTYLETLICVIMYFTIENPDVKMVHELETANIQIEKANNAKTEFLSSMSHEIRTPLNAINGFSEIIVESDDMNEIKENAGDILRASQTLLEIVNGILDISKIEAGKLELVNSPYEARETFENLAKLIMPRSEEKGLEFSYYIAEDIPNILYGDSANVKKIITNLLSNAVKYTEKGSIKYEIHCVKSGDNCKLIITVEDTGRGIKQEDIDKLFNKFERFDENRNTTIEGTGLGMAITKKLIELMNGKIIVNSVYQEGSKFTVMIDQKIEKMDVLPEKKESNDTLDLKDVKILLVDDNQLNIKVSNKLLEKYNANSIKSLMSGIDAIEEIKNNNNYDIILLDDMMPKMSGTETLHELKKIENFNTPVVVLTANAISGMKEKYLNEGFDNYLSKPIERPELIRVLNECLNNKKIDNSKEEIIDNNNEIKENNEQLEEPSNNVSDVVEVPLDLVEDIKEKEEIQEVVEPPKIDNEEYLRSKGVDLDKALEALGDMEMYNDTVKSFLEEVNEKWQRIENEKLNGDMENYAIDVHSLKSDAKYLGLMKLADVAYEHELKSKDNNKEFVDSNFERLEEEYQKAMNIINGYNDLIK